MGAVGDAGAGTLEAMRRLDWKGDFIAWSHIEAEGELARLKDGQFYVIVPTHCSRTTFQSTRRSGRRPSKPACRYPPEQMAEGWIAGMVIEAALKAAGWPATPQKVADAMSNLKVDTKGLRGGPIEWTKDNHFRTRQYYRIYRWDPAKGAIARVKDWVAFDVK